MDGRRRYVHAQSQACQRAFSFDASGDPGLRRQAHIFFRPSENECLGLKIEPLWPYLQAVGEGANGLVGVEIRFCRINDPIDPWIVVFEDSYLGIERQINCRGAEGHRLIRLRIDFFDQSAAYRNPDFSIGEYHATRASGASSINAFRLTHTRQVPVIVSRGDSISRRSPLDASGDPIAKVSADRDRFATARRSTPWSVLISTTTSL